MPENASKHKFLSVTIGTQEWMIENLSIECFRNGNIITEVKTKEEWEKAGQKCQPAWCFYGNNQINGQKYGKLYNGFAVIDPRGLAPEGWHIPTFAEWQTLINFLGGFVKAGTKMKSINGWKDINGVFGNGSDLSGFNALPGGYCNKYGSSCHILDNGYWWSSTKHITDISFLSNCLRSYSLNFRNGFAIQCINNKTEGLSIRCIMD